MYSKIFLCGAVVKVYLQTITYVLLSWSLDVCIPSLIKIEYYNFEIAYCLGGKPIYYYVFHIAQT